MVTTLLCFQYVRIALMAQHNTGVDKVQPDLTTHQKTDWIWPWWGGALANCLDLACGCSHSAPHRAELCLGQPMPFGQDLASAHSLLTGLLPVQLKLPMRCSVAKWVEGI